ncbi:hypothetical protein DIJ64_09705 [Mycobacterium leprae]|uniref:Uncharacterized protein n=1 Tax=Mycobacterium leprae TaxID=1769 RepID=A0AAD0P556_MYCLR|nr:hypothetical protein [Mycobacterium leprae]AWV48230.1 hypothetical protein DIJ64_09705 [Mycobacterium leprae]OAR19955.1 hypothetical protein A8144_12675 [Mycobacterium leprae 3125609]OAX70331.1 hypothetical protein A3216_12625 [Mycobacterium leprae 7935681]
MLSEITRVVFGHGVMSNILCFWCKRRLRPSFYRLQHEFKGFPALTNFVAEERFLPRLVDVDEA